VSGNRLRLPERNEKRLLGNKREKKVPTKRWEKQLVQPENALLLLGENYSHNWSKRRTEKGLLNATDKKKNGPGTRQ